jgi:initiation factor 1A
MFVACVKIDELQIIKIRINMPNIRGGKGYKSGKGKSKLAESENVEFIERQPDQMVGRIIRKLGDLNMSVYCHDKIQRICKICRAIKKTVRFDIGDIVLISLRDCDVPKSELERGKRGDRGDILDRYHPYQYSELQKEGINPYLFINMTTLTDMSKLIDEGNDAAAEKMALKAKEDAENDIFDRDEEQEGDSEDDKDETGENNLESSKVAKPKIIVEKKNKVSHRAIAAKNEVELTLDDL